ncbi:hypothetical protein EST38_g2438 [Candolleomyces aberdarensis]|uniref:SnoaL-like domain-containing protein n=1 Tax=Candolleomyces aberdarensis TaxID=2316362 RepID=A0A4Q2DSZ8_9AGAR|nr:hypothetical protein EST38_g2438 [Candolleomyces aberdarensis]
MRFITSFITVLLLAVSALALNVNIARTSSEVQTASKPKPPKVCDPKYNKADLAQKQYEAVADFADLFVNKQDVLTAFNRWVPGEYKQHNPFSAQGREAAIKFLSDSFKSGTKTSKLTFFAGQGYGMQHFKMSSGNTTFAVVDYFKFRGTCIVEHWDVLQTITGTELNPIAFF